MSYDRQLYTTPSSAIDAGVIYDQTEAKMQNEINAEIKDNLSKSFTYANDYTLIANNTNLNSIVNIGNYRGSSNYTYTNYPYSSAIGFALLVFRPNGATISSHRIQVIIPDDTSANSTRRIAYRLVADSTAASPAWTEWRYFAALVDLDDYVKKTGGTVTGAFAVKSTNVDTGTYDSSNNTVGNSRLYIQDKNGDSFGYISSYVTTSGREGLHIRSIREVNSSTVSNYISLLIDSSGGQHVALSNPAQWREALGLGTSGALPVTIAQGGTGATTADAAATNLGVLKLATGGTITGSLNLKSSNITVGTTPSSTTYGNDKYNLSDSAGTVVGYTAALITDNDYVGYHIRATRTISGTPKLNYLSLFVDANGNPHVSVGNANVWRVMLGLGNSNGVLPVTIDQGGTGSTATEVDSTHSTGSGILTAASGFTISAVKYAVWGKVAQVTMTVKATSAVTGASSGVAVCTMAAGKRPAIETNAVATSNGNLVVVSTGGTVTIYRDFAANGSATIRIMYLLA